MKRASTHKAWAGAAIAALAALSVALVDHQSVNWADVGTIGAAFAAGYQGVYWSPRKRARNDDIPGR